MIDRKVEEVVAALKHQNVVASVAQSLGISLSRLGVYLTTADLLTVAAPAIKVLDEVRRS